MISKDTLKSEKLWRWAELQYSNSSRCSTVFRERGGDEPSQSPKACKIEQCLAQQLKCPSLLLRHLGRSLFRWEVFRGTRPLRGIFCATRLEAFDCDERLLSFSSQAPFNFSICLLVPFSCQRPHHFIANKSLLNEPVTRG